MALVTACTLDCPDACSLLVDKSRTGRILIRGNPNHPITAGFTCAKLKTIVERTRRGDRISKPLLRNGSGWQEVSWHAALDLCAEHIQRCRSQPASILHISGEGNKGVLRMASELFFGQLGSSTVSGSLCDTAGIEACIKDFGSLESNDIRSLLQARAIINWGKDLSRSSVHVAALVRNARKKGARVISISPGGDGNQTYSDKLIRIRPGTDRFLACAVLQLLWKRGRINEQLRFHTAVWDPFARILETHSQKQLLRYCDVTRQDLEYLYQTYATLIPSTSLMGWGLQRHLYGAENVRFINALAFFSGNIGVMGGGSIFNISSLRNFDLSWIRDQEKPRRRKLLIAAIGREIIKACNPPIEMIWVNGSNVVNQAPDAITTARALKQTPFVVVVDGFMTDTACVADLILPCKLLLEQEDVVGSFLHDYVQYAGPVLDAPGEARTDLEILSELGLRLDPPITIPSNETFLHKILDSPYLDTTLEELRKQGFIRANRSQVAFENMQFAHHDGKYHLPQELHREPQPPAGYPLRLLTLVRRKAIHSQIAPENQKIPPRAWISPENPQLNQLDLDAPVFLVSPLGELRVELAFDKTLHPEVVVYRRGDWMRLGGGANRLIAPMMTDLGEGTAFYSQHIRLENPTGSDGDA